MMATTAPPPRPPRRTSSPLANGSSNSIAKGATARSAVSGSRTSSSLASSLARRPSVRSPTRRTPTPPALNAETRESLATSLREETEQKELLLVQLQTKDQTISTLTVENNNIQSALNAAETRLGEFYADQARIEEEMATRIEVTEKLRTQVRELEKEKRDIQRRYNEQTATFEAERQAAYDNEQHLKSRIQSLTQARKQLEVLPEIISASGDMPSEAGPDEEEDNQKEALIPPPSSKQARISPELKRQNFSDPEQEPAEMSSLRLELSTLSTSYSSLQSTLLLLQTQLVDLKRVNHELQEENESYMILLREKTLSGKFDVRKQVGGSDDEDDDGEELDMDTSGDVKSTSSATRSTLDPVEEEMVGDNFEQELQRSLEPRDIDSHSQSSRSTRHQGRHGRKRGSSTSHSPDDAPRGESLAGLPLTGPGLDLAAELGRAENKDILEGDASDDRDHAGLIGKGKRSKKFSSDSRKVSEDLDFTRSQTDVDALRTEVKSLKDANKALSLYASKIIDRIISMEGFEHVLAVDFDKVPTPTATSPNPVHSPVIRPPQSPPRKARPQSAIFGGRSSSNPTPSVTTTEKLATFPNPDTANHRTSKIQRRSLSFDWKNFSIFSDKKPENASLRPLTLKPGAVSVTGISSARKLDTEEDEEDRRERDRLQATMKLMGIEPNVNYPTPMATTSFAGPIEKTDPASSSPPKPTRSQWSILGGVAPTAGSDTSSIHSTLSMHGGSSRPSFGDERPSNLTHEALRHVEAEQSLAALDAHEQVLSAEIARGAAGGFTEIPRRGAGAGRRSRRSGMSGSGMSGSASTVWSAGNADGSEE